MWLDDDDDDDDDDGKLALLPHSTKLKRYLETSLGTELKTRPETSLSKNPSRATMQKKGPSSSSSVKLIYVFNT